MARPRRSNPSKLNLAERRWYRKNKAFKDGRANARNKARRKMGSPAGKDIHHKNGNPHDNSKSNLAPVRKYHGRKTYSRKKRTKMRHNIYS